MNTVGNRIVKARELKKWDRPKLAKESGVPYPTLAGLENGDQQTSSWIPAIAEATGVNASWLAYGKGGMLAAAGQASQSLQLDPETVRAAHKLLREVYADDGKKYDIEAEPDLFLTVCDKLARMHGQSQLTVVASIGREIERRKAEGGNENGGDGRASGIGTGKGKKRASR